MTNLSQVSTATVQRATAYAEALLQQYAKNGQSVSGQEYAKLRNDFFQKALAAEVKAENAESGSIFEKKSDIQAQYNEESLAYYKDAIADGMIDYGEMAGMPVELREKATQYAGKANEARIRATEYAGFLMSQWVQTMAQSDKTVSQDEYNTMREMLFQKAFKAELNSLKYNETVSTFGIEG